MGADLQSVGSNASIETSRHPQNVRLATDDNPIVDGLPHGTVLSRGGYNAFWIDSDTQLLSLMAVRQIADAGNMSNR